MDIKFEPTALKQYDFFRKNDKNVLRKIIELIEDIKLHPYVGIGKPEQLKHELTGFWSREINSKDRIIYKVDQNIVMVYVVSAMAHYSDK